MISIPCSFDCPGFFTMSKLSHHIPDHELPHIAVGILSYNRAAEVITSLDIILGSDYPVDKLHCIVVDNASTDGTEQQVKERYGERVEVLRLPENIGAVARNRIIL